MDDSKKDLAWMKVYENEKQLAEKEVEKAEQELRSAKSHLYEVESRIRDVNEGFNVGDRVKVWEASCQRGCCGNWFEGVIKTKNGRGGYEVQFGSSVEFHSLSELKKV